MGNNFDHIKGFGSSQIESFNSLRSCFIYYHGKEEWEKCHITTKHKDKESLIQKSYEKHYIKYKGITYSILWLNLNNEHKCYISS